MNVKINYVYLQNGTTFYLLNIFYHSWAMGLNFGGMVLSQPNLIRVKERTFSLVDSHQNLPLKSNFP
jgi:hypothetical protein